MNKEQLTDALLSKSFLETWEKMNRQTVTELLGEEAGQMVGFDQRNPHHCYPLYEHCLHTVENAKKIAERKDVQLDYKKMLLTAALFHDIAKPIVCFEKNGRLVFYGHAIKSAEVAESILEGLGYQENELREILFLIAHHDDFISFLMQEEYENLLRKGKKIYGTMISEDSIHRHVTKKFDKYDVPVGYPDWESWRNLIILCQADAMSQAEETFMNGNLVATRAGKVAKILEIENILKVIYASPSDNVEEIGNV